MRRTPGKATFTLLCLMLFGMSWQSLQASIIYDAPITGEEYSVGFKLKWSTAQEQNSQSFVIERSFDGTKFTDIGTVEAAGNSDQGQSYSFTDLELGLEKAYYRLRQVDLDGSSNLSEFVTLSKTTVHYFMVTHKEALENGLFEITLESIKEGEMRFLLNNAMGDIIQEDRQPLNYGLNTMVVNLEFEAPGFYSAVFKVGNELETLFLKREEDKNQKKNVAVKKKSRGF